MPRLLLLAATLLVSLHQAHSLLPPLAKPRPRGARLTRLFQGTKITIPEPDDGYTLTAPKRYSVEDWASREVWRAVNPWAPRDHPAPSHLAVYQHQVVSDFHSAQARFFPPYVQWRVGGVGDDRCDRVPNHVFGAGRRREPYSPATRV